VREHLQLLSDEIFSRLGYQKTSVFVEIINDPKILAGARGVTLPLFNVPFGRIYINRLLDSMLSSEEIQFILAHEAVHIHQNHLPVSVLAKLPKIWLDELSLEYPGASVLSLIWDSIKIWIYGQGGLPPEVNITKQQELQADVWAIFLTRNKTAAINCLKKLVNNDLNQPSHEWEVLDVKLPVMTMQERIGEIMVDLLWLETQRHKFK